MAPGDTATGPWLIGGGPTCPGAGGVRSPGGALKGCTPAAAGTAPGEAGLCSVGSPGRPVTAPVAKPVAAAGVPRMTGPGEIGRRPAAGGGMFSCRATAGVTPTVVEVGRSGCAPMTGRTCAS